MASSLFQNQEGVSTPPAQTDNLRNMMQMFRASKNPQAFVQMMLANSPNSAGIMQLVNQNGGDPKAAFYALAKQRGIDPEVFLKSLH